MVQYFEYNAPFPLERGGELPALRIAYHTYGRMNAAGDNVVWVCHALTANSDVADWWPHTVDEGALRSDALLCRLRQHPRVALRHDRAAACQSRDGRALVR